MSDDLMRPMCFVAMPFGKKAPPGRESPRIDFDRVYNSICRAADQVGLECVRADFESNGGFIARPMFERLMVAEFVVADVTLSNPNVAYEIGVRHGCGADATILVCARAFMADLPFDLRPLRVMPYDLDDEGNLATDAEEAFRRVLSERLTKAVKGQLPPDNPLLQLTSVSISRRMEHEKIDVFLKRVEKVEWVNEKIAKALCEQNSEAAIEKLVNVADGLLNESIVVTQLHTCLISVLLRLRNLEAFDEMVELLERESFPRELRSTPVAIEQYALATNRLAEASESKGNPARAAALRSQARDALGRIPSEEWTSETYGVAGRIFKGWFKSSTNDVERESALDEAIHAYEEGYLQDMNDYYPGVNAVTLRLRRNAEGDLERVAILAPAVRVSVEGAPAPKTDQERYYQAATNLELACASRDWPQARLLLREVPVATASLMDLRSTAENLEIHLEAFSEDDEAVRELQGIIDRLRPEERESSSP